MSSIITVDTNKENYYQKKLEEIFPKQNKSKFKINKNLINKFSNQKNNNIIQNKPNNKNDSLVSKETGLFSEMKSKEDLLYSMEHSSNKKIKFVKKINFFEIKKLKNENDLEKDINEYKIKTVNVSKNCSVTNIESNNNDNNNDNNENDYNKYKNIVVNRCNNDINNDIDNDINDNIKFNKSVNILNINNYYNNNENCINNHNNNTNKSNKHKSVIYTDKNLNILNINNNNNNNENDINNKNNNEIDNNNNNNNNDINNNNNNKKREKEISKSHIHIKTLCYQALTDDLINNNEKSREKFKEDMQFYIINDDLKKIDELYLYNPDRNIKNESQDDFIFNQPLKKNKKTLLYICIQEGKLNILEYFIKKGLNPKIDSCLDNIYESNLECACRWNYIKIVKFLLLNVEYNRSEILKILKKKNLSNNIIKMLKTYLKNHPNRDERVLCFC